MLVYSENRFHYLWNTIVTIAASYIALYLPLTLEFDVKFDTGYQFFYWIVTLIFVIDFVVNIYRAKFIKAGNSRMVGNLNVGFWLLVDLIAAIPFFILFDSSWLWLLQLIKLLRVAQYMFHLKHAEVRHALSLTLAYFCYWIIHLIHWLCCGWLVITGLDPLVDSTTNYVNSLYWIMTTLTSVGYGDIVPVTNIQKLYAIGIQVIGVGAIGYLIGNFVSILSKRDPVVSRYLENVELMTTTLKRRDIPQTLQKRILSFYTYLRNEKMGYDESAFFDSLPESLKNEVAFNLKKDFIHGINLFKNASEKFIYEIALKLELIVATPGDHIFRIGDYGNDMFFIISGELEVLNEAEDKIITILKEGDFFGEIALIKNQPRTATIKAINYCNLYKLTRKIFDEMISKYPDVVLQIEDKAKDREAKNS